VYETLKCVKECKIDLILLDLIMPYENGEEVLKKLETLKDYKYKPDIIVVSGDTKLINKVKSKYTILDVVYKDLGFENALSIINKNISNLEKQKRSSNYKEKVLDELLKLKYNIKHNGTKYIMETIMFIIDNYKRSEMLINNLEKDVYPLIAHRFEKSVGNIKNNIVKATNNMYNECEMDYLIDYFGYGYDKKPTPKIVIITIVNKVMK
ncbi:MAG: hypothetical protein IKD77_01550, partial [Bacilli bacterium]|nr:hypothetical protein [Bacilli bacterium]